ncbi:MAG: EAL domain-containing protein, partial [Clostridia bacterium]
YYLILWFITIYVQLLLPPLEFIHIAEKANLIIPLGNKLLRSACIFINKLEAKGINTKIAVNISGIQLLDEEFSENVIKILDETNINPEKLELEITESILLNNFDLINERLKELRSNGIDIALDDFGKGYSSFFRLDELNVNSLKIDKSFIDKITIRSEDRLITSELIGMAHKFNLKVVAEGVESKDELDYLKENNCDIIQGYLFSKPLTESKIITLLRSFEASKDFR